MRLFAFFIFYNTPESTHLQKLKIQSQPKAAKKSVAVNEKHESININIYPDILESNPVKI